MVSSINNEFSQWVTRTQNQGHFNSGQANFIKNKFNETIGGAHGQQSLENRKNWFFNWVNGNAHLTSGNKRFIINKVNNLISQNPLQNQQSQQSISLQATLHNLNHIVNRSGFLYFYDKNNTLTYFLGNFYPSTLNYQGLNYSCLESAFQAAKFNDPAIKQQFCHLDGDQAWRLARQYQNQQRADWFQNNIQIMTDLLKIKFNDPTLKNLLLSTSSAYLVEHTPVKGRDNFWADDCDGTGQNMLGRLLMYVRQQVGGFGEVPRNQNYDTFLQTGRA